ncbi:transcription factor Pcc1-domain-containing protein [Cadophora sp. MPI-SDFR-AT-0126]|nr:transcription factor Pcc1-domain-containing protein [Leotiomycetes sp. MPI-SDFR-AT-0126]
MTTTALDTEFPCSLTIDLPLPTARLASIALRTLVVDAELSPLVRRSFSTIIPSTVSAANGTSGEEKGEESVLRTEYKATTNRMLRVAVNGFMESLSVVLGIMEELDVDVFGKELEKGTSTLLWAQLPYGSEIPAIPAAIWGLQMDRYSPAVGQLLEMFGFGAESPGHP